MFFSFQNQRIFINILTFIFNEKLYTIEKEGNLLIKTNDIRHYIFQIKIESLTFQMR